jgi:hypothetical protein
MLLAGKGVGNSVLPCTMVFGRVTLYTKTPLWLLLIAVQKLAYTTGYEQSRIALRFQSINIYG